jgi:hypothetical protein
MLFFGICSLFLVRIEEGWLLILCEFYASLLWHRFLLLCLKHMIRMFVIVPVPSSILSLIIRMLIVLSLLFMLLLLLVVEFRLLVSIHHKLLLRQVIVYFDDILPRIQVRVVIEVLVALECFLQLLDCKVHHNPFSFERTLHILCPILINHLH